MNLIGIPLNTTLTKLYSASINGFGASNFHSKCDNILGTLTIIKTLNNNVFGGFTNANWVNSGWQTDANSFIFSLINQYNYPIKLNITNPLKAVYAINGNGPTFGNGQDFYIADQSNSNTNSFSQLGNTYQLPFSNMTYGSTAAKSFLAGSYNFQTIEIEVFSINGNLKFFHLITYLV